MRLIGLAVVLVLSLVLISRAQETDQTFGAWTASCEVDKMTDAKRCFLMSSPIAFAFYDGRVDFLHVGTKHYPGSGVMLRVDSDPPLFAKEPGFSWQAEEILKRFATAQRILTRYHRFAGGVVDNEVSMRGFADALAYVRAWYERHP